MSASPLFVPLTLPNGLVVPNRIAKAAMEENLADPEHLPGPALLRLYSRWADGGAGLILTGNVMIDARALTGPGGVVLDDAQPLAPFAAWARAIGAGGGLAWMQINHPGRQVYAAMAGLHRRWSPVSDYWVLNTTGRTVRLLHQLYHIAEKFEVEPGDE